LHSIELGLMRNADGGGVRGLSEAVILERLLQEIRSLGLPEDTKFCEIFDLMVGVSTGG
jgi:patatin-like phospholipase/acyl hydrolase